MENEPLLWDGEYVERFLEALDELGGNEAWEEGCGCRVFKALLADLSSAASRALLSAVLPCAKEGSSTHTSGTCGTWDDAAAAVADWVEEFGHRPLSAPGEVKDDARKKPSEGDKI